VPEVAAAVQEMAATRTIAGRRALILAVTVMGVSFWDYCLLFFIAW
jgi:hypothetical protein